MPDQRYEYQELAKHGDAQRMRPMRKAVLQNDLRFSSDNYPPSPLQSAVGGSSFQISSQVFEHFLSFPWGDNRKQYKTSGGLKD